LRLRIGQHIAAVADGGHPDADLLAAYAERRLDRRERAQLSAHLADCDTCRRLAFLIRMTGPAEPPRPAAAYAPQARLRWAMAAAGLAVALVAFWAATPGRRTGPARVAAASPPVPRPVAAATSAAAAASNRRATRPAAARAARTVAPLARTYRIAASFPPLLGPAPFHALSLGTEPSIRIEAAAPVPRTRFAAMRAWTLPGYAVPLKEPALPPLLEVSLRDPDRRASALPTRLLPHLSYAARAATWSPHGIGGIGLY